MRPFILALAVVVLSGCSATFDENSRQIAFKNGTPYYVPYGTNYGLATALQAPIAKAINCKAGDVFWFNSKYYHSLEKIETKPHAEVIGFFQKLVNSGNAGCVPPMSDQAFDYRKGDEARRENNAAKAATYTAPADTSTITNCYGSGSSVQCYSF